MIVIPLNGWDRPPLRSNDRRGWPAQARAFAETKHAAMIAVRNARTEPLSAAHVTLVYRPANHRRQDADGLAATLKPCLDALVACGVLEDDSAKFVPQVTMRIDPPGTPAALWLELSAA